MAQVVQLDCVVVGAGVVGLAIARRLQVSGREVYLLEAESRHGTGASSRNSEVIHAGIYYPEGSLKAALCVRGREMLYAYCADRGIPHRRLGKIIVAVTAFEESTLEHYLKVGQANGVHDLQWISRQELNRLEPQVTGTAALWSPSTGIVDSHCFMGRLLADFQTAGGHLVRECKVACGYADSQGILLELNGKDQTRVQARTVVNSAGLNAPSLARRIQGTNHGEIPCERYAIGHYFSLLGPSPFQHLVYPVPERGGLGVHVTLDLAGTARFGPDVQWIDQVDYTFDASRKDAFAGAISRYCPLLNPDRLVPAYTGIRAKTVGPTEQPSDFQIHSGEQSGHPSLLNLFGIESPGLTASLAIAEHVETLLHRKTEREFPLTTNHSVHT